MAGYAFRVALRRVKADTEHLLQVFSRDDFAFAWIGPEQVQLNNREVLTGSRSSGEVLQKGMLEVCSAQTTANIATL